MGMRKSPPDYSCDLILLVFQSHSTDVSILCVCMLVIYELCELSLLYRRKFVIGREPLHFSMLKTIIFTSILYLPFIFAVYFIPSLELPPMLPYLLQQEYLYCMQYL